MDQVEQLRNELMAHIQDENRRYTGIQETLVSIKENHLFHIEKSMAELETDVRWIKESMNDPRKDDWLIWAVRLLMGAVVGGTITYLILTRT